MNPRLALVTVALVGTVAFLTGMDVAGSRQPPSVFTAAAPAAGGSPTRRVSDPTPPGVANFAEIAARANPAVVNIDATSRGRSLVVAGPRELPDPFDDGPGSHFRTNAPRRGAGSGFAIDPAGYILTNYHVVEDADRLTVKLADGRSLRAKLVGSDPDTDVALIKVDSPTSLPTLTLGDSTQLRVGDWVCAIGNPLGYEHTLTVGVVSYLGRKLFDRSLDNYIQTDAAINFGNSGGPLISARGEVVGINAAISSRANNIGFAVPIATATADIPQLKARGRVVRGYMGLTLREVDPDLRESLGLPAIPGALVEHVFDGSPAQRAGVKPYDLVTSADGRPVTTADALIREVAALAPGVTVQLHVWRDGGEQSFSLKLAERPGRSDPVRPVGEPSPLAPSDVSAAIGLNVKDLTPEAARRLRLPKGTRGALVSDVEPLSPAYDAELERGYVILEINRRPVTSAADCRRLMAAAKTGQVLAFFVVVPGGQHALRTVRVEGTP